MDFRFFTKCQFCNKKRWFVAKRTIPFPGNSALTATSKKLMCGKCIKNVKAALETNAKDHA